MAKDGSKRVDSGTKYDRFCPIKPILASKWVIDRVNIIETAENGQKKIEFLFFFIFSLFVIYFPIKNGPWGALGGPWGALGGPWGALGGPWGDPLGSPGPGPWPWPCFLVY